MQHVFNALLTIQARPVLTRPAITTRTAAIWLHKYPERSAGSFIRRKTLPC